MAVYGVDDDWVVFTREDGAYTHRKCRWHLDDAGHLFLFREDRRVAIYAPGQWKQVTSEEETRG